MDIKDFHKIITEEEEPSLFDDEKEEDKVVPDEEGKEVDMETAMDSIFDKTKDDKEHKDLIWRLGRKIAMLTQTPIDKEVEDEVKKMKDEDPKKIVSTGNEKEEEPKKEKEPEEKKKKKEDEDDGADSLFTSLGGVGTEEK